MEVICLVDKFDLIEGIEILLNRKCFEVLGNEVYVTVSSFSTGHYVVSFCLDYVPYIIKDARIIGDKLWIDFPSKNQFLKEIKKRRMS
jgi:hypothetical protein